MRRPHFLVEEIRPRHLVHLLDHLRCILRHRVNRLLRRPPLENILHFILRQLIPLMLPLILRLRERFLPLFLRRIPLQPQRLPIRNRLLRIRRISIPVRRHFQAFPSFPRFSLLKSSHHHLTIFLLDILRRLRRFRLTLLLRLPALNHSQIWLASLAAHIFTPP